MPRSSSRSEDRLAAARTRRMLEDTAIAAVGGGHLISLSPVAAGLRRWRASVRRGDGACLRLLLDRHTGSVEMEQVATARAA